MASGIVSAGLTQHDHAGTSSGNKISQAPLKPEAGDNGAGVFWSAIEAKAGTSVSKWGLDILNTDYAFDTHGVRVRAAAGKIANMRFANDSAIPRWTIKKNDTGESGSNAGSDLEIFSHTDAGQAIAPSALIITRSSGAAKFGAAFGCNNAAPQTPAAVNAGVTGVSGAAYTSNEQTMISDLQALVNQLRAALVANGICV